MILETDEVVVKRLGMIQEVKASLIPIPLQLSHTKRQIYEAQMMKRIDWRGGKGGMRKEYAGGFKGSTECITCSFR
jgi:hypothetical protein